MTYNPHHFLIKQLQQSHDVRDQAMAALLIQSDRQEMALFGKPEDPVGGLVGRVNSLEKSRGRAMWAVIVLIPLLIATGAALIGAIKNLHDLAAERRVTVSEPQR